MPEEVKLASDDSSCESSVYATDPLRERETSRSESSSCSDESTCFKMNGHEGVEIIPTRTLKTSVPKPAANPLQFVKIGPCDLYRSAQQQLQKVGEVKKPKKEIKDEIEDWQSNLDSWKCNRRKQQEHIIERVVEVKKLEIEEHDRNRKRTKTFSEMMEDRTSKGRKLSLPVYLDEDVDDLSDLGLSPGKCAVKSSSPIPEEIDEKSHDNYCNQQTSGDRHQTQVDNGMTKTEEEATYESAIQSYETRMKSLTNGESRKSVVLPSVTARKYGRRCSATKIEEKLSELERIKNRSLSSTDLTESNRKQLGIPKVNIFQRKEMFEKISDTTDASVNRKCDGQIPRVRSIKERLSSLERQVEEMAAAAKTKNVTVTEVSVKDRLSTFNEKIRQHSEIAVPDASPMMSAAVAATVVSSARSLLPPPPPTPTHSLAPHLPSSTATKDRIVAMKSSPKIVSEKTVKANEYEGYETSAKKTNTSSTGDGREYPSSGRSSSSEDYENVSQVNHFHHHRSLDSLHSHDLSNGFCFDRVQSLECIDCCSNYPASVLSGDTDREDSGIHTADVSSSVSQADDFDLHADTSMDVVAVDLKAPSHGVATPSNGDEPKVGESSQNNFLDTTDSKVRKSNESGRGEFEDREPHPMGDAIEAEFVRRREFCTMAAMFVEDSKEWSEIATTAVRSSVDSGEQNRFSDVGGEQIASNVIADNEKTLSLNGCNDRSCEDVLDSSKGAQFIEENVAASENGYHQDDYDVTDSAVNFDGTRFDSILQNKLSDDVKGCDIGELNEGYSNFVENITDILAPSSHSVFAFESSTAVEPPKEKPPPPPPLVNSDDDEIDKPENLSLRRMDSTRRIKKEIRQKRSSFLGIDGYDDDSYLEPELESVKRPPDMTTFLQEERRLEKLLYRQSICSESDSTQGESRDSGVELDKNQIDEHSWIAEDTHSRQDSETYANTSTTSEEDEIIKKEREILEILELEEQRNFENDSKNECDNLGEKLVLKLKELERRKNVCCNRDDQNRLHERHSVSVLPNNMPQTQKQWQLPEEVQPSSESAALLQKQWAGRSLQDVSRGTNAIRIETEPLKTRDYRSSMPNIRQELTASNQLHRVPPPIPPNKPAHLRESTSVCKVSNPQQMSKQTLQALSAVPRSKLLATDSWVLSKKKPRQEAYNYQHWLIQEAEQRRITEYHLRYSNDNGTNNYVNVHPDYSEKTSANDAISLDYRLPTYPNRSLYAHPQMLPHRNHNQNYIGEKKPIKSRCKPLPDSVIQTLTQRVQNRLNVNDANKPRRRENFSNPTNQQEKMLSVSGKKKCSHCGEELGRGAAMIIESLRLFYHIDCFKCCVCCVQLGDGLMGTDVRVRNSKLHCHSCYSNDEGRTIRRVINGALKYRVFGL